MVETIAVTTAVAGIVSLLALSLAVRRHTAAVPISKDGYQDATIRVNGRYRPEVVTVHSGRPVRLRFLREEDAPCSERVIFEGLGIERRLPTNQETSIELTPSRPGSYMFTCQMGIYRGWLVVVPAR